MTTKKPTTAPQAARIERPITPVMVEFLTYIEAETGYKPDPMSVQLGSLMRADFQKSSARQSARATVKPKTYALHFSAKAKAEGLDIHDPHAPRTRAKAPLCGMSHRTEVTSDAARVTCARCTAKLAAQVVTK